jgi:signal transduction histidine kinase
MLDLARVEAGKLVITRVLAEPGAIVDACVLMLSPLAEGAGVTLERRSVGTLPALEADPVRLRQVFVNIIGNAIKFTPRGGRVSVSAEMAESELRVQIADTGIGMRAEDIPLVVKPFHRLSSPFDAKYQGVGLGPGTIVTIALPLRGRSDNQAVAA